MKKRWIVYVVVILLAVAWAWCNSVAKKESAVVKAETPVQFKSVQEYVATCDMEKLTPSQRLMAESGYRTSITQTRGPCKGTL